MQKRKNTIPGCGISLKQIESALNGTFFIQIVLSVTQEWTKMTIKLVCLWEMSVYVMRLGKTAKQYFVEWLKTVSISTCMMSQII